MQFASWLTSLLATTSKTTKESNSIAADGLSSSSIRVTDLYRYAVKGLSGDRLDRVVLNQVGETFPDDRRYALLREEKRDAWKEGEWLHKENFLCAFSDHEFFAQFQSSYHVIHGTGDGKASIDERFMSQGLPYDVFDDAAASTQRLLTLRQRKTGMVLLNHLNLQCESDRARLAEFFSRASGKAVTCVTSSSSGRHEHQFGNTSSGYKQRGDTRTVHIINQATIDEMSKTLKVPSLQAKRFRPNIVLNGVPAWEEFSWVGTKQLVEKESGLTLTVISRTVRCKGVSVDPEDYPEGATLDIPRLLAENYPEHGPYLGVYAVLDAPGSMQIGSEFILQDLPVNEV